MPWALRIALPGSPYFCSSSPGHAMPSAPSRRPAPWDTPWSPWPGPQPGQLPAGQGQPGQPWRCWEKQRARRGWAPAPHLWGSPLGCQRPSEQPGTTRCSWVSLASEILGYMSFMASCSLLVMPISLLLFPMMSSFPRLYICHAICKPKCGCRISTRPRLSGNKHFYCSKGLWPRPVCKRPI